MAAITPVRFLSLVAATAACTLAPPALAAAEAPAPPAAVDLALCLDTSGSMDGLLESAKQKLWSIVNDLALAQPTPKLRVALLTFGNDGYAAEDGWVRVDLPLTEDLDAISQRLFALETNGGTELVGRVLNRAGGLDWHPSESALKLAVVAGNESADQDQTTRYPDVCKTLITRGIMVNAIYCGSATDDIAPGWQQVARLADGQFASIDKDDGLIVVETPFDAALAALSASINTTYLPFGEQGTTAWANQKAQDDNAAGLNQAAAAQRCATKGSALYCNTQWDLVDASKTEDFDLASIRDEDLPEVMQPMAGDERLAYIVAKDAERASLRAEIADLTKKRQAFVDAEMKKLSLDASRAFDTVLRRAIRAQAESKGFRFPEAAAAAEPAAAPVPAADAG